MDGRLEAPVSAELDPRYRPLGALSRHNHRLAVEAEDRLTGCRVVLKTDDTARALRELEVLLALPPEVGPRVVDAIWTGERLILVLERLPGETLQESAVRLSRRQLPTLLCAIAEALAHLHRTGFVHADLNPSNIQVLGARHDFAVRLLDYGFALGCCGDLLAEAERGGAPPFMAPELLRGWVVDGRADQYSLGRTLLTLLPDLDQDPDWAPILSRLCQELPADRFADVVELREAVRDAFTVPPREPPAPHFGAGPCRGRDAELASVSRRILSGHPPAILVQARPGVGLSRFLLECVAAVTRARGPAMRLLDLGAHDGLKENETLLRFLEDRAAAGETLLCGVADPSPSLHRTPPSLRPWLRKRVADGDWERFYLAPLEEQAFVEILADSLGSGGGLAQELAQSLYARTDADLRRSAEGFLSLGRCCGTEKGLVWTCDRELLGGALSRWAPEPPPPHLTDVEQELRQPLMLCAHVGRSLPIAIARGLLSRFAAPETYRRLIERGYLLSDADDRVQFLTASLWSEAASHPHPASTEVDAWLLAEFRPDPGRVPETLRSCHRARRLGDPRRESQFLTAAIDRARETRIAGNLLRLFSYPGPPPEEWTVEGALQQVGTLREILTDPWSADRILCELADALRASAPDVAIELFQRVSAPGEGDAAVDAHIKLLETAINRGEEETAAVHLEALESMTATGDGPRPGILDFYRALGAQRAGQVKEAERHAGDAARRLSGSGSLYEALALQLLAVHRFGRDPHEGIRLMGAAVAAAREPEKIAQFRYNLTLMHERVGDQEAAAACAEEGIVALHRKVGHPRRSALRLRRAWNWASLDRIAEATREAQDLLTLDVVRRTPFLLVPARLLLGYCLLHRHSSRRGVSETARAWEESQQGCPADLRADALIWLIDALLDVEAWDTIRHHGAALIAAEVPPDPGSQVAAARAGALLAQAEGRLDEAAQRLEAAKDAAEALGSREEGARYWHHLGLVRLARAKIERGEHGARAVEHFREELSRLGETAHGYFRTRALLLLAEALVIESAREEATRALDDAIDLARRIESLGLLSQCLRARADLLME